MVAKRFRGPLVLGALALLAALPAGAAVAPLNAFPTSPQLTATTGNMSGTFSVSAGTNRLLVVTVQCYDSGGATGQTFSATYGGQALTQASVENSNRRQTWMGYLKEAGIAAAGNTTLSVTITGTHTGVSAYVASYSGVDQITPITASGGTYINNTNNVAINASALAVNAGGYGLYNWSGSSGITRTSDNESYAEHADAASGGVQTGVASKAFAAAGPTTNPTVTWSANTRCSVSFITLNSASSATTVGNGTNPSNASPCPGGAATMLDAFTLETSAGTDTVTGVTVTLAAGTSAGLSLVEITNDAGGVVYGSVANPGSDTPAISLTTNISATTTLTQYKVRVTPKSHAAMPVPPGATYAVTGTVTAITSSNTKTYSDTASATVTIDNLSTANPTWGANTAGNTQVVLNWTTPADVDFNSVLILRKAGSAIADTPVEGTTYTAPGTLGASTTIYAGTALTFTDTGLSNGAAYYYEIFARDTCGNWSTGAAAGPYTPSAPVLPVTPGVPTATANTCTQIVVSAPYAGDTNGNSTTTISRGASSTGPWTTVCSGLTGASPRTCTDNGVVASTSYYYQVTFADTDGVNGTNPQVIGPYTTSACTQNSTTAGTASAAVTGCLEITVMAPFTGDDNSNGSVLVQYNTTNTWPGTTACAAVTGPSPRVCVIPTPAAGTYYVRVTYTDPDTVSGTAVQVLPGTYTTTACGGDAIKPVVTVLTPSRYAVVSGADTFKVQVYDANALDATAPVQFALDGGTTYTTVASPNANYSCGTGCKVYELPVGAQTVGSHFITIRAKDASGNVGQVVWPFQARATTSSGTGTLLRRSSGSQLCMDCHAIETHSAQYTSTKYGSWAIDCTTCHTPHKTYNLRLVKNQIETPNSGTKTIVFQVDDTAGGANPQNSYLGAYTVDANATPTDDGVCEACHTKTTHYRNVAAGSDHNHNQNQRCVGCHQHGNGFGAQESDGCGGSLTPAQAQCSNCHPTIWQGMTGTVAKNFKHTLGATAGTNDACSDTAITWASPLNGNAAGVRSCVNMCHQDHVHNSPSGTTHDYNVHQDATTNATRAVTRGAGGVITAGTPDRTDFSAASTNGGMCLSCHQFPVESGTAAHPALSKTGFDTSAHDYISNTVGASTYNWTYTEHDGSTFARNCTKCHADRGDGGPNDASSPFGAVHYSDYQSLLAGSTNPAGTPATFVCYNCHGNGTTGQNYSGKDIATQIAKASNHPANADAVHNSVTEFNNAAFGNTLGVTGRHANCQDCHDPHEARTGTAASPGNLAGPPLQGAWGAQLSSNPAFWTAPASANFTKKTIVAGTDLEATLCFKCHSAYYGTLPTSPSGGFTETDTAKEFNPANNGNWATAGTANQWSSGETAGGFHPVLATAGSNLGAVNLANLVTTNFAWLTSGTTRNLMSCSDCHESNNTADPNGPHGSTASFILRGPNTTWSGSVVQSSTGMPAGTFCINCHSQTFTSTRFAAHYSRSDHRIACWNCHAAVPHGGPRPGMLIAPAGAAAGVGGTITGWDTTSPYWGLGTSSNKLYIASYPTSGTSGWGQSNCGCNGTGH